MSAMSAMGNMGAIGTMNQYPNMRTNYTVLFETTQQYLGFDPSLLINASLILAAISTGFFYSATRAYRWASGSILSSAHIAEEDQLFNYVMDYMGDKYISSKRFRSVKAKTSRTTSWEQEERAAGALGDRFDAKKLISYRAVISRAPISLTPYQSKHLFRHRGSWLYFQHSLIKAQIQLSGRMDRSQITLQCLGRSQAPIRAFLEDTQVHALQKNMSTTVVYRAIGNNRENPRWTPVLTRPSRDIRTVILDREKKQQLLIDINEYLHPRTRRWYSNRGIPYRRGYLFSGPPGTGKTSLTAALAGVFGLNIYVLSLLDPAINESALNKLMSEIPSRSILLIEDVDAAGLKRPGEGKTKGEGKAGADKKAAAAANQSEEEVKEALEELKLGAAEISLSGLLNAIDGVSSHEGRILVMTTNHPEELDSALTRPGRVDIHIAFQLPGPTELRELFLSMFREEVPGSAADAAAAAAAATTAVNGSAKRGGKASMENGSVAEKRSLLSKVLASPKSDESRGGALSNSEIDVDDLELHASQELQELAARFAAALPDKKMSLASVQGYLLRWKRDPVAACDNAAAWAEEAVGDQD